MDSIAINDMLERGQLQLVDMTNLEEFLGGEGLQVLFFAGDHGRRGDGRRGDGRRGDARRGDAHDVAVALREVLKDYQGKINAGLVVQADEAELQPRFRVLALPSLVLVLGGETLEVIPRVRDWSDYVRAFRAYLGGAADPSTVEANS
jgi:hydrogenase-1 operon protein HyaE